MTTKSEIREWLERGAKKNATHMIVVCDTYDWDDYPVFVSADENVSEAMKRYDRVNMQKIMEVYNLGMDIETQLNEPCAMNIGDVA